MYITYEGDDEIIVTTKKNEKKTINHFFKKGARNIDKYDRYEHNEYGLSITARLKIW